MTQEEIDFNFDAAKESMNGALEHLRRELKKVRTGKANPSMFDNITADYYGSQTPLQQIANFSIVDARTITITPWEKSSLQVIEKALFEANLGLTPQNDGEIIRINFPPLTEERRKEFAKQVKAYSEDAKVSIRNARKDLMDAIKKAVKDGYPEDQGKKSEDDAQKLTNDFSAQAEKIFTAKEKEIMTI